MEKGAPCGAPRRRTAATFLTRDGNVLWTLSLFADDLVYALARDLEMLGEAALAAGDQRVVVEHVANRLAKLLCALRIAFGHGVFSDTLDTRKNGLTRGLLRSARVPTRTWRRSLATETAIQELLD